MNGVPRVAEVGGKGDSRTIKEQGRPGDWLRGASFPPDSRPLNFSLTLAYSLKQVLSELSLCKEPFGVTLARGVLG